MRDPIEVRAAAVAYLTVARDINADDHIEDGDPRWATFDAALDRFNTATGIDYQATHEAVAELLVEVIPE